MEHQQQRNMSDLADHRREDQSQQKKIEDDPDNKKHSNTPKIPLMALNHVSRLCRSVDSSVKFYTEVLGFVLINRPPSLNFIGAWLFNYGVGIHLVQKEDRGQWPDDTRPDRLDPMDNHISFQCDDMEALEGRLKEMDIKYLKRTINEEEGAPIDQLFFNDPDGFMIEICNCENLELVPVGSFGNIQLPRDRHNPPVKIMIGSIPPSRGECSSSSKNKN